MGSARGMRALELTDFVRWETRGARGRAVGWMLVAGGTLAVGAGERRHVAREPSLAFT